MGEDVEVKGFTREDRRRYRDKVRRSLDVFARLLGEAGFDPERRSFGLEIERLEAVADTIAPEAACTSVQLHGQVEPEGYAVRWNAAQAIAAVQLALGANSPYFFGRELWRET